ncbi:hypothetical protein NDU88_000493 [Pleurodeles waltl]|uniref:Uncharacterized protein n=1 Tax=Pleurodeles waltl TaxID=8319 RepID=A0AAV7S759_PLEWA|nr:hypothetical protein NDU88_000493 [Pleurodeles waltl]
MLAVGSSGTLSNHRHPGSGSRKRKKGCGQGFLMLSATTDMWALGVRRKKKGCGQKEMFWGLLSLESPTSLGDLVLPAYEPEGLLAVQGPWGWGYSHCADKRYAILLRGMRVGCTRQKTM